jgi:PIN domain nuclease of toxin-antitoxin system
MNFYVSDTHALFWYLINAPALGVNARLAFDEADAGRALIYIPAIVIAELYYLNEKKGRPLDFRTKYARLAQSKQFVLLPFYPSHTLDFDACSAVTEMHDRMIAADARRINAALLTRDAQITSSGVVATVW